MNGDRPEKSPKPPLKALKVDKQLGRRLALYWGGRTKTRAHSLHMCTHAQVPACTHTHTNTNTHMYGTCIHMYTHTYVHTYAHTHAHTHARTHKYTMHEHM